MGSWGGGRHGAGGRRREGAGKVEGSIQWVPADAAYYGASYRMGEIVEIVGKSRAWARLTSLPVIEQAIGAARSSDGGAKIEAMQKNPQVREALSLLGDMFSQEFFVYAGPEVIETFDLLQRVNITASYGPMFQEAFGRGEGAKAGGDPPHLILATLAKHADQIKVPNLLCGFKVKNRDRAVQAIGTVQTLLGLASMAAPQLADKVKRKTVAEHEYLTIELDGSLVPWDKVEADLPGDDVMKRNAEKIIARLKKMTLAIALGVRENYLLVAIGPSTDLLGRLGKEKGVASLEALGPIEKHADCRITGISYASPAMIERLMSYDRQLTMLVEALEQALAGSKLGDAEKAEILKDARQFAADVGRMSPKMGSQVSVSCLVANGLESHAYTRGERFGFDGTKPLELLRHVAGRPILAFVGRGKSSGDEYDVIVRWAETIVRYVDKYAVPKMNEEERATYAKAMERLRPLGARFNEINRTVMLRALADDQAGFVLDSKLRLKQLHREMPEWNKAMPLPELAVLCGVSDAELLRKGLGEYRKLFNDLVDVVRDLAPNKDEVPNFKLPEPEKVQIEGGTLYVFRLPEEWGVAKEIAPTVAVAAHVAAVTMTPEHARRLMAETPLGYGGTLADASRPMAMAGGFDWAGLVDTARPWIELAMAEAWPAREADDEKEADSEGKKMSKAAQVRVVLDVLKCMRTVTSAATIEDGMMVTHSLVEFRDLAAPKAGPKGPPKATVERQGKQEPAKEKPKADSGKKAKRKPVKV